MDPRERWQTLQAHLSAARFALKMGDRDKAREEVTAALAVDPEFLAAKLFRERLDAPASSDGIPSPPTSRRHVAAPQTQPPHAQLPPTVSPEAFARLEERVKQRVRAREARVQRPRRSRWLAAGVVFLGAMSSARVLEPRSLDSYPRIGIASLLDITEPEPIDVPESDDTPPPARPYIRPSLDATAVTTAPVRLPAPTPPAALSAPPPAIRVIPTLDVMPTAPVPVPAVVRTIDERSLVQDVLQRYRRAYDRLDARSAQAVYPSVNEQALARAFNGLESQTIVFDSCDVDLRGGVATATCRGSSRYVPKVGSREPRVEPRIWNFTLRKDDGDWKIDNARAER